MANITFYKTFLANMLRIIPDEAIKEESVLLQRNIPEMFKHFRDIIQWAVDNYSSDLSDEFLRNIDTLIHQIKPHTLCLSKHRHAKGSEIINHVESIILAIKSKFPLPQPLDSFILKSEFRDLEAPWLFGEVHRKIYFRNTLFCMYEMKDLLIQGGENSSVVTGLDRVIPFLSVDYIDVQIRPDVVDLYYQFYANLIQKPSREIVEFLSEMSRDACKGERLSLMKRYMNELKSRIADYQGKLLRNTFTEAYIKENLMFITRYLFVTSKSFSSRCYGTDYDFVDKVIASVDVVAFMLSSIPLIELLKPCYNQWVTYCLADVIYAAHQIVHNIQLADLQIKSGKIKNRATQLQNMCMKQVAFVSRAAEERHFLEMLRLPENVILPDSYEEWKLKFKNFKTFEKILASCPQKECNVCARSFNEILKEESTSEDLAVVNGCRHLHCVECLLKTYRHAPNP